MLLSEFQFQLKPPFFILFYFTTIICFLGVFKSLNYGVFGTKKKTPTFYEKTQMSFQPCELNVEMAKQHHFKNSNASLAIGSHFNRTEVSL